MNRISAAMHRWGPLGVSVFTLAILAVVAAFYFGAPHGYDAVSKDPPKVPVELIDHADERAGLERGYQFGAEPATPLPRPDFMPGYGYYPSPNFSGRGSCSPEAIVLHITGPGSMAGMRSWFGNAASQVSAHFGIGKNGELDQYVPLEAAAWHAGIMNLPDLSNPLIARWKAEGINPNRCHVGIELLIGGPAEPLVNYPAMENTLRELLYWLNATLGIPLDRVHVIGHYQLDAINRSTDPRCCVQIDELLASLAPAPTASPWGECDTSWSPGGCWHLEVRCWVSSIGLWCPDKSERGWQSPPLP